MARKPRIEFEGALYHVVARGNRKENIFRTKGDYERYLDLLLRYKERYHYQLYAFVLMPNHLHLLMQTADINLSRIMQGLQQSYTAYFNLRYAAVGHLFQGRFKAILCDQDAYLLTLVKYIHLNPVRAEIAARIDDYPWSSHHAYLRKGQSAELVNADFVLNLFDPRKAFAVRRYQEFMDDAVCADREEIYGTIDQRFLGDDQFVNAIVDKTRSDIKDKRKPRRHSLENIMAVVETITGISREEMRSKGKLREISKARTIFSRVALNFSYKVKEIAEFLEKDPSAVSRYPTDGESAKDEAENVMRVLEPENVNNQA
jgi:REP element-mobilizing transposase RayT